MTATYMADSVRSPEPSDCCAAWHTQQRVLDEPFRTMHQVSFMGIGFVNHPQRLTRVCGLFWDIVMDIHTLLAPLFYVVFSGDR
jgi:hypothetical protein